MEQKQNISTERLIKGGGKMTNRNESLALEIYDWCCKHDLWGDNIIYFNGKALSSSAEWGGEIGKQIDEDLYEYEGKNPFDYIEFANSKTITMSFEGPLNHILNGYVRGWSKLEREFAKLFEKYGLYYEMGYAWSLSAYEL